MRKNGDFLPLFFNDDKLLGDRSSAARGAVCFYTDAYKCPAVVVDLIR